MCACVLVEIIVYNWKINDSMDNSCNLYCLHFLYVLKCVL